VCEAGEGRPLPKDLAKQMRWAPEQDQPEVDGPESVVSLVEAYVEFGQQAGDIHPPMQPATPPLRLPCSRFEVLP
jgi:hypothetical protein